MRQLFACLALPVVLVGQAFADDLANLRAATDRRLLQADGSMRCFPDMTGPAEAHVLNTGARGAAVQTSLRTTRPVFYSDFIVDKTDQPVLLILVNSDEVVWRPQLKPGARVAGVWLSGNVRASITGLPESIPLGRDYEMDDPPAAAQPCGTRPGDLNQRDWDTKLADLKRNLQAAQELARRAYDNREAAGAAVERLREAPPEGANVVFGAQALVEKLSDVSDAKENEALVAQKALQDFQATGRPPPPPLKPISGVGGAMDLLGVEFRLKTYGAWPVVAVYRIRFRGDTTIPVVSAAAAREFLEAKARARAALPDMKPPPLKILPPDVLPVTMPEGATGTAALDRLVASGYAVKNGPAQKYLNNALKAQHAAIGVPITGLFSLFGMVNIEAGIDGIRLSDIYTILGPVIVPSCGIDSVPIYVPDGVPDPQGPCRWDYVYREADLKLRPNSKVLTR